MHGVLLPGSPLRLPTEPSTPPPPPPKPFTQMSALDFEHHANDDGNDDSARSNFGSIDASEMGRMYELMMDAQRLMGPLSSARYELIEKLEKVEEATLVKNKLLNERCSICYTPFGALIAEEEMMLAMDTPGASERALGVTRLQRCGHYFCRKDISKWILEGNDLCPYCRAPYLAGAGTPSVDPSNATPAPRTPANTAGESPTAPEVDELEAAVRLFESQNQWTPSNAERMFQQLAGAGRGGAGRGQQRRRPAQQSNNSMYS